MKYDDDSQEAVAVLAGDQLWTDGQSGESDSPTGWFGRISLDAETAIQAAAEIAETLGTEPDAREMVGHWLVTETGTGHVYLERYDSENLLGAAFDEADAEYGAWLGPES